MKIEDAIDESILAVFHDPVLARRMILKGGSAMRMLEEERNRLSLDADFSIEGTISAQKSFFARVEKSLSRQFAPRYRVFDFRVTQRPRHSKPDMPKWWKGWLCQFKLIEVAHADLPLEVKRRRALIPEGSNSPVIEIEISEHEYCGAERTKKIRGVVVHGYTRELLVVEKLRAICQQHPDYRFRSNKNRARDFYDIYKLCSGKDQVFFIRCQKHLPAVFKAKAVPVSLLKALWDKDFLSVQRSGFTQVKDSTKGIVRDFDVYVEYVRYLVGQICPEALSAELVGHPINRK